MDVSQISELASAIMDSWACASGAMHPLAMQQHPEQQVVNKAFAAVIKQEVTTPPPPDFPGIIPMQGYPINNPGTPDQVPMDDFDPLESFSFWDDNFYSQHDLSGSCDMQTDANVMPTLPEYLEDEDGFVIKETTLLNNPTLAELNSGNNDTLFEYTLGNDSPSLPEDNSYNLMSEGLSKTFPGTDSGFLASPLSQFSSSGSFVGGLNFTPSSGFIDIKQNNQSALSSSCPTSSRFLPTPQFLSAGDDKFLQCPQNSPASEAFFIQRPDSVESRTRSPFSPYDIPLSPVHPAHKRVLQQEPSLLSSSAPPDITMATYLPKIKREPPSHSPGPRGTSERSLSGFSNLSLSNDDNESGSFFDSDNEDDFSSDEDIYQYESDDVLSTSCPTGKDDKSCHHRKHRFFWQYNLQSRGSKAHNILPRKDKRDPHILNDAFDPVFSEECALPVKHSGKARKGDGNDLTPNPVKLYNIGLELKKLNKLIYNINPHEGGGSGKPLSRKEKNKLASRVCRLKKKAQHEANKIKLYGLQQEHKKLLTILIEIKELLRYKIQNMQDAKLSNCSKRMESYLASNEPHKVAGNTAQFVNEVLEKIAKGECDGGLGQL